jgi:hypothetical protein
MATTQEHEGVALHTINFLADDNAPDAESSYVFAGNATYYGRLHDARAFAREEVTRLRLCGYEIRLNGWNGEVLESVIGYFGDHDDEDQYSYGEY